MRLTILAAILALSATVATAQDSKMMDEMQGSMMRSGISMLEASAKLALMKYGLEGDVMTLSLGQLAEINGVMTSSNTEAEIKAGIEAALRR